MAENSRRGLAWRARWPAPRRRDAGWIPSPDGWTPPRVPGRLDRRLICPLRRQLRRLTRRLAPERSIVVFHPRYTAALPNLPVDALRAERLLAFLVSEGLVRRRDVAQPAPITLKQIGRVHDADYVRSLHDPAVLGPIFGGTVSDDQVDRLLDLQRLHAGGTMRAMRAAAAAARDGRRRFTAVHLGGGLHHARPDEGAGFCLFHDVAIAVDRLRREGFDGRVLIVDLDLHDGDGTRACFARDERVHTLSVHARTWLPMPDAVADTCVALGDGVDDAVYLDALAKTLPAAFAAAQPDLVVYLAGADPAHDDALGDWRISDAGMVRRERLVRALVRRSEAPAVVLLAGGYGSDAWRHAARGLGLWLARPLLGPRHAPEPPSTDAMTFARYRHLATFFDPNTLSGGAAGDDFGLSEADLLPPGWGALPETRLLGFYTKHGIEIVLEETGFLDRVRDLGFQPVVDLDATDPAGQTVRVYGRPARDEILCELRLRRDRRSVPGFELLSIEWLLMQNPRAAFAGGRRPLPGQSHPGLGLLKDLMALLTVACDRLHLDGLVMTPSRFHIARVAARHMVFALPEARARYEAIRAAVAGRPPAEVARQVAAGEISDPDGTVLRWQPSPMVLPVSDRLRAFVAHERDAIAQNER